MSSGPPDGTPPAEGGTPYRGGVVAELRIRPGVTGTEHHYVLTDAELRLERDGRRPKTIRLRDVRSVRLVHAPRLTSCTVETRRGRSIEILGVEVRGPGIFEVRSKDYRRFVRALHERLAAEAPRARFGGGSSLLFAFGLLLIALGLGYLGLLATGAGNVDAVDLLAGGALCGDGARLAWKGRPTRYAPDRLPEAHLPPDGIGGS